jgi:micrococcal nuclease
MKTFLAFLPLILLLAACQPEETSNNDAGTDTNNTSNLNNTDTPPDFMEFPAKVSEIVDGDTIYVRYNDQRIKIRFLGVNTPETYGTVEYYGPEAKQYTRDKLPLSTWVGLEFDNPACGSTSAPSSCYDMYDRLLAYIRTLDNQDLCAQLVVNGYARVYTQETFARKTYYLQLQDEAIAASRGLWGE